MPSEPHHTDTSPAKPKIVIDLECALKMLGECDKAVLDGGRTQRAYLVAIHRFMLERPDGLKGTNTDGDGRGGSDHSDPTAVMASKRNRYEAKHRELQATVAGLLEHASALERFTISHLPRIASPEERKKLERENKAKGIFCVPCSEAGYETESHAHTAGPETDEGHVLAHPVGHCRWHYDFLWRYGQQATKKQTEAHHRGVRVMVVAK